MSAVANTLLSLLLFSPAGLQQEIERIASRAHGRVGAAVMVVEGCQSVSLHGHDRFPLQSVYKLPIAMAALRDVDHGRLTLDRRILVTRHDLIAASGYSPIRDRYPGGNVELSVLELLRFAISESDGTASDVLLRIVGGPPTVNGYLRGLGIHDLVIATTEAQMQQDELVQYRNWGTPDALVELLR